MILLENLLSIEGGYALPVAVEGPSYKSSDCFMQTAVNSAALLYWPAEEVAKWSK